MICKFCGMDSATTEVCSWCGQSLRVPATPDKEDASNDASAEASANPESNSQAEVRVEAEAEHKTTQMLNSAAETAAPSASGAADKPSAAANVSARKVAPGMPMPSRLRPPTPAASSSSLSSSSLSSSSVPSASLVPLTGLKSADPGSVVPLAGHGETSAIPSLNARVLSTAPSLLPQAEQSEAPETPGRDFNRRDYSTPIVRKATEAASASITSNVPAETPFDLTIGTGVSPARGTATPVQAPTIDEKQRKAAVNAALADSEPASRTLLLRYAVVFAIILIVTGALCFVGKQLYVIPMLIAMFLSALLLPVMRVTPWADEDADDLIWFVLLTLLFGPLVALIIYSFVSLMRQSCNASILGCLAVVALVRITAEVTSGGVTITNLFAMTSPFASLSHIDAQLGRTLLLNWSGFTALAGWYAASSFHKENE